MPARQRLVFTLWLTSSLVLLASVLAAPLRTSGFVTVSSRPDGLRGSLTLPPGQPTTCLSTAMATDTVAQVNALPAEDEERDPADALGEPQASLVIPCSFRKVLGCRLIARRPIPSLYPLRC